MGSRTIFRGCSNGLIQNRVTLPQLAHLPLGSTTAAGMSVALWRTDEKLFSQAGEYRSPAERRATLTKRSQ
jgi:hypothetical protein